MELTKLQRTVVDALDDIKAQDIRVFNTVGQTTLFDRVIIASGSSNRQTRSLAGHVCDKVKAAGGEVISIEGSDSGEWVLVDLADIVVHIMQPTIREYYNLEEIWGAKTVNLRIGAPPAKKPAAKKAAVKKAAVKNPRRKACRQETGPRKPTAKKPAAGKPVAATPTTRKPADSGPARKRSDA
ncbi:MAG: ribosome silencing factor [Burkholderiaceae bacterium]